MPLPAILVPAAALCLATSAPPPAACTCALTRDQAPLTLEDMRGVRDDVDALFTGRVVRLDEVATDSALTPEGRYFRTWWALRATVQVHGRWKGVEGRTVHVYTSMQTTMCGADLDRGRAYLFFAFRHTDGTLGVTKCMAPLPVSRADRELALLARLPRQQ